MITVLIELSRLHSSPIQPKAHNIYDPRMVDLYFFVSRSLAQGMQQRMEMVDK